MKPLWRVTVLKPEPTPPYGIEYIEMRVETPKDAEELVHAIRPECQVVAVERVRW